MHLKVKTRTQYFKHGKKYMICNLRKITLPYELCQGIGSRCLSKRTHVSRIFGLRTKAISFFFKNSERKLCP